MRASACALAFALSVLSTNDAAAQSPSGVRPYWVFFRDRGPDAPTIARPRTALSDRSLERRARRGRLAVNEDDLPLYPPYRERVLRAVERIRTVSRWFNAVSVEATDEQAAEIAEWQEVWQIAPVAMGSSAPDPTTDGLPTRRPTLDFVDPASLYGISYRQNQRVGIPKLHERGLSGAGVLVCIIDAGFTALDHESLDHLNIVATHDFVVGSQWVAPNSHGTHVLSILAAHHPGRLIGPAYDADIALARSEDAARERRVEEDYWIAAVEWADSLGADVVVSSVGYTTFDDTTTNHTLDELDGASLITQAADRAVERGIVVVVSAGNERSETSDPRWQGRIDLPGDGFGVIAVGATDEADMLAAFSSVGPTADGRIKPDVSAPGTDMIAARVGTTNEYTRVAGTSFSCPLVGGAAVLLLEAHPNWTPYDVRRALTWTAEDLGPSGPDNMFGWGIVDAAAAADVAADGLVGRVMTRTVRQSAEVLVPVAGARVELSGPTSLVAVADGRGQFNIGTLPHGTYTVAFRAAGYEPRTVAATIPLDEPVRVELISSGGMAERYRLTPNPATPETGVTLAGAVHPDIVLSVFDIAGSLVHELPPGQTTWNLTSGGRPVAAGVYICRATIEDREVWRGKLAVIR